MKACNDMSSNTALIPIRGMRVNQKGTIRKIAAKDELGRRIRDMGLIPGAEFMVVGRAPLNDPVALRMSGGYTITLRNSEADHILCEVEL